MLWKFLLLLLNSMAFIKTITQENIEEFDLLFYRPSSFFWRSIVLYDAFYALFRGSFKNFFRVLFGLSFSHVGIALKDPNNRLRRFDAMEWLRTWFRHAFENCYVFTLQLTEQEKQVIKKHMYARKWSFYDIKWIFNFVFPIVKEDEFRDFCSELQKNWLVLTWSFPELDWKQVSPFTLYMLLRQKLTFKGLLLK